MNETAPEVGMGATTYQYSDRKAWTVMKVSPSGKTVTLQRDTAKLLNGYQSGEEDALKFYPGGFAGHTAGNQRYEYSPNPEGETCKATLRKDGTWRVSRINERVKLGGRHEHYDFNF